MKVATGIVVDGKVVVDGSTLAEGSTVTVLLREDDEAFDLTPEEEAELVESRPTETTEGRAARLEVRVTTDQKRMLQQASALSGRTLSEFVVASAQEAAAKVIQAHETIRLTREEQIAFVGALLDPPPPNARLRKAAAKYRRQTGR